MEFPSYLDEKCRTTHAGLYLGFTNNKPGNYHTQLEDEADKYAQSLENMEMKDNTNKKNIKATSFWKNGKTYIRVGPFNWSFPGTMDDVKVYNQDGKTIDGVLYSSFEGTNEKWFALQHMTTGKRFLYIFSSRPRSKQNNKDDSKCRK